MATRLRDCAVLTLCCLLLPSLTFKVLASSRRDWCPNQLAWDRNLNDSINSQLALTGKRITCGAVVYPPFSVYDEKTGMWSGYDIELFAEVARRGNFEYDIFKFDNPPQGETFDHILFGQGREVDMMCSWWGETAARKRRNVDFSIPILDTSFVLTTPSAKRIEAPFKKQFWTFLEPFSRELWLVLLFGGVFTAIFLYFVDPKTGAHLKEIANPTNKDAGQDGAVGFLKRSCCTVANLFYQGWVLVTIQDSYKPSNPWSKLYLMSWTGVLIVLLAAYTAQLTTFLIIELQLLSSINDLDDLMRSGQAVCAVTVIPFVNTFLRNSAPSLPVVPIHSISEAFPAVRSGKCAAALLGKSEVELLIADNQLCDMRIVGGSLNFLSGAFAADSANCGLFVLRVVDAILQAMREEGFIDHLWDSYTKLPLGCTGHTEEAEVEGTRSLSLEAVGGLFTIHAAFTFLALCGVGIQHLRRSRAARAHTRLPDELQEGKDSKLGMVEIMIEDSSASGDGMVGGCNGYCTRLPPV